MLLPCSGSPRPHVGTGVEKLFEPEGLADAIRSHQVSRTMNGWPGHRIRALLLALALALGMSLSVVQGSLMAAEMAVAADGAHHGPSGCDGCGGGDHQGMDAGTCLAFCGICRSGADAWGIADAAISFSNGPSGRSTAPKRPVPQSRTRPSQDPHPWLTPDRLRSRGSGRRDVRWTRTDVARQRRCRQAVAIRG